MTEEELARLSELADKASPAPWTIWAGNPWHADCGRTSHGPRSVSSGPGGVPDNQDKANIAFCAAAREALPRLVARVRELEGQLRKAAQFGYDLGHDAATRRHFR